MGRNFRLKNLHFSPGDPNTLIFKNNQGIILNMIEKKKQSTVQSNALSSANFSAGDLATIFKTLRNTMYSNKILAVIREYSTNAVDANVENNLENHPIQVTLPTTIEPVFKVRDFGKGLSEEDVYGIYSSYGTSTKKTSNKYIGFLGYGSKSGFAYSDSFTVISYHNGKKTIYEAYIDPSEVGVIAKMSEEDTDQHGIEIVINVKHTDVQAFINNAVKFYKYFDVKPTFLGQDISDKFVDEMPFFENNEVAIYNTTDYNLLVKMGNICYPVAWDTQRLNAGWVNNKRTIVKVNIGDVTFTTNREALEINNNTIDLINNILERNRIILALELQKNIDNFNTPYEAYCYYHNLNDFQKKILNFKLEYKGQIINDSTGPKKYDSYYAWILLDKKNYKDHKSLTPNKDIVFIVNDGGFPIKETKQRIILAYEKMTTDYRYFNANWSITQTFLDDPLMKGMKIFKLSSIDKSEIVKPKKNKELVLPLLVDVYNRNAKNKWEMEAINDNDPIVFVRMERYVPDLPLGILDRVFKAFPGLKIYGLKHSQKTKNNWISIDQYITDKIKKYADDPDFVQCYQQNADYNYVLSQEIYRTMRDVDLTQILEQDIKDLMQIKETDPNPVFELIQYYFARIYCTQTKDKFNKSDRTQTLINKINEKYPLLPYIPRYGGAKLKIDYINMVYQFNQQQTQHFKIA